MKHVVLLIAIAVPAVSFADGGNELVDAADKGVALWGKSCRKQSKLGDCVRIKRVKTANHCTAEIHRVTVQKRNKKRARKAKDLLDRAVSLAASDPEVAGDPKVAGALAAARFALAEKLYENLAAIRFPTGLEFSPDKPKRAEKSKKRFVAYLTDSKAAATAAADAYKAIAGDDKAPIEVRVAAYARIGQVYKMFAFTLRGAEIPADVRTGKYAQDATAAYCDEIKANAIPLAKVADQAFDKCAEVANDAGVDSAWSKSCADAAGVEKEMD